MKYLSVVVLSCLFLCCKSPKEAQAFAKEIVDRSIDVSGGKHISKSVIAFDFRNKQYKAIRNDGNFQLERQFKMSSSDSTSTIKDVLSNDGFQRYVNNLLIEIPDTMATKYSASVNSVHYFSVLPYGLNDPAVNKNLLEDQFIKGKKYYTIKVTFNQHGGGEDYEDVFLYWMDKNTYKVDYLAYSYNEDDGKGMRFREAFNERYIERIRFVDYNNYKTENKSASLIELPTLFEQGHLNLLSKIELENVSVNFN